jgi:hypothetical protein
VGGGGVRPSGGLQQNIDRAGVVLQHPDSMMLILKLILAVLSGLVLVALF